MGSDNFHFRGTSLLPKLMIRIAAYTVTVSISSICRTHKGPQSGSHFLKGSHSGLPLLYVQQHHQCEPDGTSIHSVPDECCLPCASLHKVMFIWFHLFNYGAMVNFLGFVQAQSIVLRHEPLSILACDRGTCMQLDIIVWWSIELGSCV
jgi:hypothetical protein